MFYLLLNRFKKERQLLLSSTTMQISGLLGKQQVCSINRLPYLLHLMIICACPARWQTGLAYYISLIRGRISNTKHNKVLFNELVLIHSISNYISFLVTYRHYSHSFLFRSELYLLLILLI